MISLEYVLYIFIVGLLVLGIFITECSGFLVRRYYEITRTLSSDGSEVYTVTEVNVMSNYFWKYKKYLYIQEVDVGYFKLKEYPSISDAGVEILECINKNKAREAKEKYKNKVVATVETADQCNEIIKQKEKI